MSHRETPLPEGFSELLDPAFRELWLAALSGLDAPLPLKDEFRSTDEFAPMLTMAAQADREHRTGSTYVPSIADTACYPHFVPSATATAISPAEFGNSILNSKERFLLQLIGSHIRDALRSSTLERDDQAAILRRYHHFASADVVDSLSRFNESELRVEEQLYYRLRRGILLRQKDLLGAIPRDSILYAGRLPVAGGFAPKHIGCFVLLRLARDQILTQREDGGFQIPEFDMQLLFQACARRFCMEYHAARKLQETSKFEPERLRAINAKFLDEKDSDNAEFSTAAIDRDIEFHACLMEMAGMSHAIADIRQDHCRMILWNCSIDNPDRRKAIHEEHEELIDAIDSRDGTQLLESYEKHFRNGTLHGAKHGGPDMGDTEFRHLWQHLRSWVNHYSSLHDWIA